MVVRELPLDLCNPTADHVVNDVEGVPLETYSHPVKPPMAEERTSRPAHSWSEWLAVTVQPCALRGRGCLECAGPVKPGSLKSQNRRTALARGREALIDQLAADNDAPHVFLAKVKRRQKTSSDEAWHPLRGRVHSQTKLASKKAKSTGFTSVLDRFNRDNVYACSLTASGSTRRSARIMDCLNHAHLPNPGRTMTHRRIPGGWHWCQCFR